MSRGLRILHIADSHIGAQLPARPRAVAAWRRGHDFVASFRRVLARAGEFDVDLVLHAGDVFDEPSPSDSAIAAAASPLLEVAASGIPVVIVPGNHERSALPAALLFQHPNLHILAAPSHVLLTLRGLRVVVAGAPCVRRRSAARFPAAIEAAGWRAARGDVNILLAHQTFESAVCGPANYKFRSGEDVVERTTIPESIHYVAAGHVHRHQVLAGGAAPIVYAGSVDRISFAEECEPKGCVLIEEDAGVLSHRFLEHAVRAMAKLPLDVSGRSRQALRDEVLAWAARLPADALAQVRLSGRTAPRELRGIALADHVREIRPDLQLDVASQAVEFGAERSVGMVAADASPVRLAAGESAFASLREISGERLAFSKEQIRDLPAGFGVYALYDDSRRLLYIGKATSVRSRVRQHLAARPSGAFFEGWTRAIARVEVRPAYSELEALLVEAELIRTLRPPFNRQMKQWDRYCYLCEGARPHGELTIARDLPPDETLGELRYFGPYRSRNEAGLIAQATAAFCSLAFCRPLPEPRYRARRSRQRAGRLPIVANLCERYFAGICMGPCAGRAKRPSYESAIERRAGILRGVDDSAFAAAEQELEQQIESSEADPTPELKARLEFYQILRHAFEHGRLLAEAAGLIGTTLQLAGPGGSVRGIYLGSDGLRIGDASAGPEPADGAGAGQKFISKAMLDALCTAARYQRRLAAEAEESS